MATLATTDAGGCTAKASCAAAPTVTAKALLVALVSKPKVAASV